MTRRSRKNAPADAVQRLSWWPNNLIPARVSCGATPVERVLYPVAVHFKGSGFYSTDYGRGSRRPESKDGAGGGDSDSAAKKDGDKKPETKTEA